MSDTQYIPPQYPQYPDYQQPYQPPAPPPKKKSAVGLYVGLAGAGCFLLLAFIGLLVYLVFTFTSEPVDVINKQLAALHTGDVQKAYSFCSKEFQNVTNFETFENFVRAYPVLSNAKDFSSVNRKVDGSNAEFKGTINGNDGTKLMAEYRCVKEGINWKIQYINVTSSGSSQEGSQQQAPAQQQQPVQYGEPQNAPQQQAPPVAPATSQPPSSGEVAIGDINIGKQQAGDMLTVEIRFQVTGFKTDKSTGKASVHLIQDLQTYGPDGNILSELSKDGIKELQEGGTYEEYTSASFSNTLTIPTNTYPHGSYRVRLIVHDEIGGKSTEASQSFDVP